MKLHCLSRTDEVGCLVAGGSDMGSDGKARRVSRWDESAYGREGMCWFAMIVLASLGW
jgi:hypothetical protein